MTTLCRRCGGRTYETSGVYGVYPLCERHHQEAGRLLRVALAKQKQRTFAHADGTRW